MMLFIKNSLYALLGCALMSALPVNAQTNQGPWNRPLMMCTSANGTQFSEPVIFQDSAGVPSIVQLPTGRLLAAFQWFRAPNNSPSWDRVAIKYSDDMGQTWQGPFPIQINNFPPVYQRPFDPTLAVTPVGQVRLYFSSSEYLPPPGADSLINTYSAISSINDGINYEFEPGERFGHATRKVIDPAVLYFGNQWHYTAPVGAPQEGAYRAVGANGLSFFLQSPIPSDFQHNWTGNLMTNTSNEMRFYGTGNPGNIWFKTTSNGKNWSNFINTNISGGDPSVVRLTNGQYLMIYVGPPYVATGILSNNANRRELKIYPNPVASRAILEGVKVGDQVVVFDMLGRKLMTQYVNILPCQILTGSWPAGLYGVMVNGENKLLWMLSKE